MKATYTKLRDGSWGVRLEGGPLPAGSTVTVTKRDGGQKQETIKAVVWSGKDKHTGAEVSVCSIKSASGHLGSKAEMCAECNRRPGVVMCSDSSGVRALCCRKCASGPAYERSFA